ncbi:MAG: hypothetical protein F4X66_01515 [Chloroflexi bacterium]|nr:hypothetical protein [Chloroflexota bacterium]MYE40133.1 hypothetical protein [Chloroflexota bacterium]
MKLRPVTEALDRAISKVGRKEFDRLTLHRNPQEWAVDVGHALDSLRNLQSSDVNTDYDDSWVALFYLLWYQPGQINVAYTAIRSMIDSRDAGQILLGDGGKLHVFDLGCGALAMQFAVTVAVAISLENEQCITEIRTDSYDTNKPLVTLGKKLWQQFKIEVSKDPEIAPLSEAIKKVRPRSSTSKNIFVGGNVSAESWISAIHSVYPNTWPDLKETIDQIKERTDPDAEFFTSHSMRENLLRLISPPTDTRRRHPKSTIALRWSSHFPEITRFRKEIYSEISRLPGDFRFNGRDIIWYLDRMVTWSCQDPRFLIYTRDR